MPDARTIPTEAPADRPSFKLFSDGEAAPPEFQVLAIVVTKRFGKVTEAQILVLDGDPAEEDFKASNADTFAPGKEIDVQAGYHSDETSIFRGIVVRHGLRVYKEKPSLLEVTCKDAAVALTVGRKSRYFYEATDSDVIEEIAGEAGVEVEVAATSTTHPSLVQFDALDWDFVVARAEANGLLVYPDSGALRIQPPDPAASPELTLRYGGNLLAFEAAMDARDPFGAVKSTAWAVADQETLELEAADPGVTPPGNVAAADLAPIGGGDEVIVRHGGQRPDAELQAWADAALLRSRLAQVRGRATIQGYGALLPGHTVALEGCGERFNGTAFVSGVRHEINTENWETDVEFGLDPHWFVPEHTDVTTPAAAALLPAVPGLQIGLVTALEGDPEGEFRVQVRLPTIDAAEEGVWARIATLDAGDTRGSFFRPDVGDEVVVGFLAGDPRDAVILGGLHSSAKPSPVEPADDNFQKGFFSREGLQLLFDDETKVITIQTPGEQKIILDDDQTSITVEDGSGNKVVLSSDGILLESAADLILTASGDIKLEGTNVENTANAQFKADGSAGAEFTSGGTTVLKGSLVQIN